MRAPIWLAALLSLAVASLGRAAEPDSASTSPDSAAAPADTATNGSGSGLDRYLKSLADTTDAYFGPSSAPLDTAGLDSALAFRLAHPMRAKESLLQPSLAPWLGFDRVDGPIYGASGSIFDESRWGAVVGRLGYAAGPNLWLGAGGIRKVWEKRGGPTTRLEVQAGRWTAVMDPDRRSSLQRMLRAFLIGSDWHSYLRRDGTQALLERETPGWRAALGVRDQLESPLDVTTTWSLFGGRADLLTNLPAAFGRVREIRLEGGARLPLLPIQSELSLRVASDGLGSDFDYRRIRFAAGADLPLGPIATLVPQVEYGRLMGDALPQASFYLGGSHSLRSLHTSALGGSREALGRIEALSSKGLLALAGLRHPASFDLQAGLFAASGAVWGRDPFGGPAGAGDAWPSRERWMSEVGFSLAYRPGLPDPQGLIRLDWAWGLGPNHERRFVIQYAAPLDLLRPLQ